MVLILNNIDLIEFEWDKGNMHKSEIKHKITFRECEQVLLYEPVISEDIKHSIVEQRYSSIGKTLNGKTLFISFIIRNNKIRVISDRPADRKEKNFYEKTKKAAII
ncbi:MAG: BrnT family toxin [bacterium]|nr:BrnT family toxin [bacterium]